MRSSKIIGYEHYRSSCWAFFGSFYALREHQELSRAICIAFAPEKNSKISAHWDTDSNKLFLELCVEEIRKEKKSLKSLNIVAWENIKKKFHEITGKEYAQKQFRKSLGCT